MITNLLMHYGTQHLNGMQSLMLYLRANKNVHHLIAVIWNQNMNLNVISVRQHHGWMANKINN